MDTNNLALSSLAMDLKRVALGLQRGSPAAAQRFTEEARKRKNEVAIAAVPPYMRFILEKVDGVLKTHVDRTAEDALMYSQLIQNYVLRERVQG